MNKTKLTFEIPDDSKGRAMFDALSALLKTYGQEPIDPPKPKFEWRKEGGHWYLCNANGRLIAGVYDNFPGDIEAVKAQLLRIAEVGK